MLLWSKLHATLPEPDENSTVWIERSMWLVQKMPHQLWHFNKKCERASVYTNCTCAIVALVDARMHQSTQNGVIFWWQGRPLAASDHVCYTTEVATLENTRLFSQDDCACLMVVWWWCAGGVYPKCPACMVAGSGILYCSTHVHMDTEYWWATIENWTRLSQVNWSHNISVHCSSQDVHLLFHYKTVAACVLVEYNGCWVFILVYVLVHFLAMFYVCVPFPIWGYSMMIDCPWHTACSGSPHNGLHLSITLDSQLPGFLFLEWWMGIYNVIC